MNLNMETLSKLNDIHKKLISLPHPQSPHHQIKEYITILLQNRQLDDECFGLLCEQDILGILFNVKSQKTYKNTVPIPITLQTLQLFNLLLNNTNKPIELGYILSQSTVHEGLFVKCIQITDSQFIEYYSQILKSIVMKIFQPNNQSLLRIFYNCKYPSFPIMVNSIIMAVAANQQLVRVTSKQCVLILVKLLKIKNITGYLSQLPMLMFYARLTCQKEVLHQIGQIGYLADLFWIISENCVAHLSLLNSIFNTIIMENLRKPQVILNFLRHFIDALKLHLQEYNQQDQSQKLLLTTTISKVYYRILSKYLFCKYIKCQYLSAYVNLTLPTQQPSVNNPNTRIILKKFHQSAQTTFTQVEQESLNTKNIFIQQATLQYCKNIQGQYIHSKQYIKMKQIYKQGIYNKSHSTVFSSFMKRVSDDYIFNTYLGQISKKVGFKLQSNQRIPINNITKSINPTYSLFLTQFTMQLQKPKQDNTKYILDIPIQYQQSNFNDLRGQWVMDNQFFQQIEKLIIQNPQITNLYSQIFIQQEKVSILSGSQMFINQFINYLESNLHIHIDRDIGWSLKTIQSLRKIIFKLKVKINKYCSSQLAKRLLSLHQQLQSFIFQTGFSPLAEYLIQTNIDYNWQHLIGIRKMILYETIQYLVNPSNLTLHKLFLSELQKLNLPVKQSFFIIYYSNSQCILTIEPTKKPSIDFIISNGEQTIKTINLLSTSYILRTNSVNPLFIHFADKQQPIQMKDIKQAQLVMQLFKLCKFILEQCAANSIINYLQNSMHNILQRQKLTPK